MLLIYMILIILKSFEKALLLIHMRDHGHMYTLSFRLTALLI